MQEALEEEAHNPDDNLEESPVDEEDNIDSAEEDNVMKSP